MTVEGWTIVDMPPASLVTVSLGPFLIGMMIGYILLGIVCSQTIIYFHRHFSHDGLFFRLTVVSLVILNVCLGIMDFVSMYRSIVLDFANFDKFDQQGWSTWTEPALTALMALIAHIFYICRCWAVTHSFVVVVFLTIVALLAFASGITITVYCFVLGKFSRLAEAVAPVYTWLLSTSICDISIAIILAAYFWQSSSAVRSTNVMLSRLRKTTIEAGSLTAVCAVLNLILFVTLAPASYYLIVQYSMSHLYTLSVLYTLLGRQHLRELLGTGTGTFVTGFETFDVSSPFSVIRFTDDLTTPCSTRNVAAENPGDSYDNEDANSIAMHHIRNDISSNSDLETKHRLPEPV